MCWSGRRSVCELPPLTVNVPGSWHVCGTSHASPGSPIALSRMPVLLIIPSAVDPPVRERAGPSRSRCSALPDERS
jgi:hypothetical protein